MPQERFDAEAASRQSGDKTSKPYGVTCSSGTVAYLDLPPGYYDCWAPSGAAGEHFRFAVLSYPDGAAAPTLANAAAFPAPTPAASGQAAGVPTGALGAWMAPANASLIKVFIERNTRLACLYSAAGPVTLWCSKVMG